MKSPKTVIREKRITPKAVNMIYKNHKRYQRWARNCDWFRDIGLIRQED